MSLRTCDDDDTPNTGPKDRAIYLTAMNHNLVSKE